MKYEINTISELEHFITEKWNDVNTYLDSACENLPMPIYNSVDIREDGHKMVPVDNNIYPAGFNNVCMLDLDCVGLNLDKFIKEKNSSAKQIGILVESHTKNKFYLDHLSYLKKALLDNDYQVSFISFDEKLFEDGDSIDLISASNFDLTIFKIKNEAGIISTKETIIDFVILNNDQSDPIDVNWSDIKVPIHPSPEIGWFARSKSGHFIEYRKVLKNFCDKFSIDYTLMEADFQLVDDVDFSQKTGLEKLAKVVDEIKGSHEGKKVFIKGDQGTYGMGISVVSSGQDVLDFNRKDRKKMNAGKNNLKFTSVIVQEGVDTILKYDDMPAEVTIYLVNGKSVGGFMRANSEKGAQENLNSRGMVFKKFCISEIRQNQDHKAKEAVYSVIARLSSLASAHEIMNLNQ